MYESFKNKNIVSCRLFNDKKLLIKIELFERIIASGTTFLTVWKIVFGIAYKLIILDLSSSITNSSFVNEWLAEKIFFLS